MEDIDKIVLAYSGGLDTSVILRWLIAKKQIEIANKENSNAVAHGATGKGNDQVRFELTYYALEPGINVIAPWREWNLRSRKDLIEYAKKHGIDVPVSPEKPYSCDRNIFHTSYEGGILEDPWNEPPESMFEMTVSPEKAPDEPMYIDIGFEEGIPVSIDGQKVSPAELIHELNKIGGVNGVGRVDMVENRFVGIKSRGVYETPGGTILHAAHRSIESITLDREVMHLRDSLMPKFSELIYNGFWYSPEMEMLKAAVNESQNNVSGTARIKIYKGNVIVVGRRSNNSLYKQDLATFEEDKIYDQSDATGFIKLNALRLSIKKLLEKNNK